ncbi:hypothetical protein [Falsigemmobacter faecalis]|uniref:hypothetical protein n=1 Tax=Falsigemmobacter faecalis TaxID=2488730 RepID=UPI0013152055|nr:hypothetical protein [Falsigemmobacter faecalis]
MHPLLLIPLVMAAAALTVFGLGYLPAALQAGAAVALALLALVIRFAGGRPRR